ncbi:MULTISPECIES: HTH domain-containing protein [unclassified Flammeovirga]|uniref:HTH domain-containing protein n=1 Tax=unclassified Flammeovirga TaxID=2637820 RepID=UPI0005C5CCB3|nr:MULTISPECIES: HTH domain-containing protein [unclassified Flammeovirga]MBD0404786.1 HTH domain-containing protein [Flammeovirga sp. EKP202]
MLLQKQLERIERIDYLIRKRGTGTPIELAEKLEITDRTLRTLLTQMREMGAEIYYDHHRMSYVYKKQYCFFFGFIHEDAVKTIKQIS